MHHSTQVKVLITSIILILAHIITIYGHTTPKDIDSCVAIFENKHKIGPLILYSDSTFFSKHNFNLGGKYGLWSMCGDTLILKVDLITLEAEDSTMVIYYKDRQISDYGFPTETDEQIYPAENWPLGLSLFRKFLFKDGALYSKVPGTKDEYYQSFKQVYPDTKSSD